MTWMKYTVFLLYQTDLKKNNLLFIDCLDISHSLQKQPKIYGAIALK